MDIDNIIIDSIPQVMQKSKFNYPELLSKSGFLLQYVEVNTGHHKDRKFEKYLKETKQTKMPLDETTHEKNQELIVIRPTIKYLIEQILALGVPTTILICSKSNNERVKSIIKNLNFEVNKTPFNKLVKFVPKESFLVYVSSFNGKKTPAKSSSQLRNSFVGNNGKIQPNDFVFLIDKLPDSQFILTNRNRDLNIRISPFDVSTNNKYNIDYDQLEINSVVRQIYDFIKNS